MAVGQLVESQEREGPSWLPPFLMRKYFDHCNKHTCGRHEMNQFCVDCCAGPYCPKGLSESHSGHSSVQVRKASHRDAVRIVDIQRFINISNIQLYSINGAKIVFLRSLPQPKVCKGAANSCDICRRSLADQVRFCSISCKLEGIRKPDSSITEDPLTFVVTDSPINVPNSSYSTEENCNFSPSTPNSKPGKIKRPSNASTQQESKRLKKMKEGGGVCFDEQPLSPQSVLGAGSFFADSHLPSSPENSHESFHFSHGSAISAKSLQGGSRTTLQPHRRKQLHPIRAPFS